MNNSPINLCASFNSVLGNQNYIGDPLTPWSPNFWQPTIQTYYPSIEYKWFTFEKNKTELAFKISQKLIESKKLEINTVKDFIDLVNIIIETL